MSLSRRTFIGCALASAAMPGFGGSDGRIARVGLMTDTHVEATLASCDKVRAALELVQGAGAELVVNCGDIANCHCPEGYRLYRLACERRTAQGWTAFPRDDIFGDFWKAEKNRTGRLSYRPDRAFFAAGETCRLTVTPLGWFGRPTEPIAATFTATAGRGASPTIRLTVGGAADVCRAAS